ncbi:hypothetical protein BOSE21B_30597 [Bosea sp. 21B]|nr:hypothetical protein BOSE21B_30597 [Bosea sp. 21B]
MSRSVMTSPSLPSEYQAMRTVVWACAIPPMTRPAVKASAEIQCLLCMSVPSPQNRRLDEHLDNHLGKRLPSLSIPK